MERKKILSQLVKTTAFIVLVNLPFVTLSSQIGLETFIDSYEHPSYYLNLNDLSVSSAIKISEGRYIFLQKTSHPSFTLNSGDTVLYYNDLSQLSCNTIRSINKDWTITRYYLTASLLDEDQPVFEHDIVGRVVGIVDDNLWNSLSLSLWKTVIENLNINALFAQD